MRLVQTLPNPDFILELVNSSNKMQQILLAYTPISQFSIATHTCTGFGVNVDEQIKIHNKQLKIKEEMEKQIFIQILAGLI